MDMYKNEIDEDSDLETSQSLESFNNWGKIISEVEDCLPAIHSDSEENSSSDDNDIEVKTFYDSIPLARDPSSSTARDKKQSDLLSSSFLLFQRLNCKHRKHQFHEAYQDGSLELPIFGEPSRQSTFDEKHSSFHLKEKSSFESQDFANSKQSSDSKFSYSLKGLEKFSLDNVSDTLILDDEQQFNRSATLLETSFKDDKSSNAEKILDELVHLTNLEKNSVKNKTKCTTSRGVTADLPMKYQRSRLTNSNQNDQREPETLHIDLRPSQNSSKADDSGSQASTTKSSILHRRSMYKASAISEDTSESSEESDGNERFEKWKELRKSYKKNHLTQESKPDKPLRLESAPRAIPTKVAKSKSDFIDEETRKLSIALISQKVKNVKAKKRLTSFPKEDSSKIEVIENPTSTKPSSSETSLDGIYASQRLKKPVVDAVSNGDGATLNFTKNKIKTRQSSNNAKNESNSSKTENNHTSQNAKTKVVTKQDQTNLLSNSNSKESKFNNNKEQQPTLSAGIRNSTPSVNAEVKQKFLSNLETQFSNRCTAEEAKRFPLLYDSEVTYDSEPKTLPNSVEIYPKSDVLLLTIKMSPVGCVLLNRAQGHRRYVPADITSGMSITYALLLSWILALIPYDLKNPFKFNVDSFRFDRDHEEEAPQSPDDLVSVPFNVVALHQTWQEESQAIVLNAVIVPNDFYNPHKNNRRKKPKKDYAFYETVKVFLQSNRLQEVCPWHFRPESPIFFSYHDVPMSCAKKPMSSFITLTNDYQIIRQVLRTKADFMWKPIRSTSNSINSTIISNELQTTTCLLQREAFVYPIATLDFFLRFQHYCLDIASLRLIYLSRTQLNKAILTSSKADNMSDELPCIAVAVRGKNAIKTLISIIGPRDPILARMTDRGSLNALYGEQISKQRGDVTVPTEMNVFYSPRSEERARYQLLSWFAGRYSVEDQTMQIPTTKLKNDSTQDFLNTDNNPRCSLLSAGCLSQVCLIVSPRFSSRFLGELLQVIYDRGFTVDGFKQMVLHDKTSSFIPPQYIKFFHTSLNSDITFDEEYYEVDDWWRRPATVILLSRENAIFHRSGLLAAIQSELLYHRSESEPSLMELTHQCFHLVAYTDVIAHALNPMFQVLSYKLESLKLSHFLNPDPELEQVVVLSVLGRNAVSELARTLQSIFHFACENQMEVCAPTDDDREFMLCEEYRGFELMGMKYVPSLQLNQAKELIPCEIGTIRWFEKLKHFVGKPAFVCVLRRVNALTILQDLVQNTAKKESKNKTFSDNSTERLISLTAEMAFRQIQTFFSARELFSDNQNRFLLKFLPPSAKDSYYFISSSYVEDNDKNGKLKSKKKKTDKPRNNHDNSYSNHLSSLLSPTYFLSSILIIKPDAFPRHFIKILKRVYRENFKVVAAKLTVISEDQALQIAPEKYLKMPGEQRVFVSHVTSGPSMVLCVQRSNGVRKLLELAGPLNPRVGGGGDICRTGNYTLREEFGIDEFSNAVHVSESYSAACEEVKLFFPDGLCCNETTELHAERIPAPGVDRIICQDKMKGREVKVCLAENGVLGMAGMEIQPVCVILTHTLVLESKSPHAPPCVDLMEQLTTQGYEICALRMAWLQAEQAGIAFKLMGGKSSNTVTQLSSGPSLLMIMQRENGLILFDSIIERFLKLHPQVESNKDFLRSQSLAQTHEITRYFFNRIEVRNSALQIAHKRIR